MTFLARNQHLGHMYFPYFPATFDDTAGYIHEYTHGPLPSLYHSYPYQIISGWWFEPLWKMMEFVSWDDDIPN